MVECLPKDGAFVEKKPQMMVVFVTPADEAHFGPGELVHNYAKKFTKREDQSWYSFPNRNEFVKIAKS